MNILAITRRINIVKKFFGGGIIIHDGEISWTDHVRNEEVLLIVKEQRNR